MGFVSTLKVELVGAMPFKAKSAFLANMSHELLTPLNAILRFTALPQIVQADAEKFRQIRAERLIEFQPEDLKALPEELRSKLLEALVRLDTSRIADVVNRVRDQDTAVGSTLAHRARFEYSEILEAIKGQRISVGSSA